MFSTYLAIGRECPTGEQNHPLQLLVEEEVVEAPQGTFFSEWI